MDDWQTIPFVSVRVTDDKCNSNEESMFVRRWGGTERGCSVFKISGLFDGKTGHVVMTVSDYDEYIRHRA